MKLDSFSVPKFLFQWSANSLATKATLLWLFSTVRLLDLSCVIVERSHVFNFRAAEKDLTLSALITELVVACHHQHHHDHHHHHLRHHLHGHLHGHLHHLHRHHHLLPFLLFLEGNVVLLFLLLLPLLLILLRFNFLYFWTFYFHFRNSTSLGWTVFNRVIVWFNHLQCILHSGTLTTGGVIWWICWWTPRNKVPLTWNL